ncbi:hypothetical protein ACJJTC_014238 [Scirpophaga incertulas]
MAAVSVGKELLDRDTDDIRDEASVPSPGVYVSVCDDGSSSSSDNNVVASSQIPLGQIPQPSLSTLINTFPLGQIMNSEGADSNLSRITDSLVSPDRQPLWFYVFHWEDRNIYNLTRVLMLYM